MGLLNLDATIKNAVASVLVPITGATTPIPAAQATVSLGGSTSPQETVALERMLLRVDGMVTRSQAIAALRAQADAWFGNSNYVMTELVVQQGQEPSGAAGYWNITASFVMSRS